MTRLFLEIKNIALCAEPSAFLFCYIFCVRIHFFCVLSTITLVAAVVAWPLAGWLKQYSTACSKESGGDLSTASWANSAEKPMVTIWSMISRSVAVSWRVAAAAVGAATAAGGVWPRLELTSCIAAKNWARASRTFWMEALRDEAALAVVGRDG